MDHTQVNLIQLKTFELELDFAYYIQYYSTLMCGLRIFAGPPIYQINQIKIYFMSNNTKLQCI